MQYFVYKRYISATDLFGTWDRHGRDSVARGRETVSSQDNATNHVKLNNKIILLLKLIYTIPTKRIQHNDPAVITVTNDVVVYPIPIICTPVFLSLAQPDSLRTGAYRAERVWPRETRFSSFLQQYSTDGYAHAQNCKREI